MRVQSVKQPCFSAAVVQPRSINLFVRNANVIAKDFIYGKIHNIDSVRTNAFVFSSLIQVLSRVFVANNTARKTAGTPEGSFRHMEAVKTTFRELMGFTLSYGILRYIQRGITDCFRNYVHASSGISSSPTIFDKFFRKIFRVPANIKPPVSKNPFPGFVATFSNLFKEGGHLLRGTQGKRHLMDVSGLFPDVMVEEGVKAGRYLKGQKLIKIITPFAGKKFKALSYSHKLRFFFTWAPPILASIPAMFLSGFLLEWFSQNHAESMAKKITDYMNRHKRLS